MICGLNNAANYAVLCIRYITTTIPQLNVKEINYNAIHGKLPF